MAGVTRSDAPRDNNRIPALIGVSNQTITVNGIDYVQNVTPVPIAVDVVKNAVLVEVV